MKLSLILATGLTLAAASFAPQALADGKALYLEKTCIACHGADAKGVTGLGKDLTTSAFVKDKTNAALIEFVKTGRPASDPLNTTGVDMPPKGGNPALSDMNILDIVAYLRSIQQ